MSFFLNNIKNRRTPLSLSRSFSLSVSGGRRQPIAICGIASWLASTSSLADSRTTSPYGEVMQTRFSLTEAASTWLIGLAALLLKLATGSLIFAIRPHRRLGQVTRHTPTAHTHRHSPSSGGGAISGIQRWPVWREKEPEEASATSL